MKKSIFIVFIFQLFRGVSGFAQEEKVDSLRKILPSLTDTARIDCLNKLGVHHLLSMHQDSSAYYINIVYEESKKNKLSQWYCGVLYDESCFCQSFLQ